MPLPKMKPCDRCGREAYVGNACVVCGDRVCIDCQKLVLNCLVMVRLCKRCGRDPKVRRMITARSARLYRYSVQLDARLHAMARRQDALLRKEGRRIRKQRKS